jgi:DNA-binding NtrC family response regulator
MLLACPPLQVDPQLRRSLVRLVNSCHIEIVHDGYQLFQILSDRTFDLFIIDFAIPGIDSLELIESIRYIDPGVPVILIVPQNQPGLAKMAQQLMAHPIIRPFEPITFLRLVDRLLPQRLGQCQESVINWQIINQSSGFLTRLEDFCRVG